MKDGSENSDSYREMYEDLSRFDEDEALVAAPPATKKQAAPRSAARPAGKRSRPVKTRPWSTSPDDNRLLVKAIVIHGARPIANTIQDVGMKGIMGHAGSLGVCGGWVKPPAPLWSFLIGG